MSSWAGKTIERGEFGCPGTFGHESIFGLPLVGVAERHAADDDLALRDAELLPQDRRHVGERGLGTGVEAAAARSDHQRTEENAEVEPAPDLEILVQREDEAHGRVEEVVVAAVLTRRALEVALPDP